ncbi:hypothetical protein J2T13_002119 [Paenibacillus sp. DS2015]|uniref:helix-turn-helix domain-containing protein n=1 Tax=Paenibacillus sp. DS2015 TaxID=3373917 RepID=UPI003D1ECBFE
MQFSEEDKRAFGEIIEETSHMRSRAEVMFKVFYNIAMKFNAISPQLVQEVQNFAEWGENAQALDILSRGLQEVGGTILSIAEHDTTQSFTTGQLAKIFGVSISTINNWIDAKRFVGFTRGKRNEQARISESTVWRSMAGENLTVGEVFKLYNENQKRLVSKPEYEGKVGYIRYLVETIGVFEARYDGKYETTVKEKGDPNISDDFIWAREGKEWLSLLREIELI